MKTPDKIYIPFYPNDDGIDTHLGDDWFDNKDIDQYVEGWKEYIRKDALIEWAEETYLSENASAIRKVCFKQLVEKLMSM